MDIQTFRYVRRTPELFMATCKAQQGYYGHPKITTKGPEDGPALLVFMLMLIFDLQGYRKSCGGSQFRRRVIKLRNNRKSVSGL